jgi:hypothetical protein
MTTAKGEQHRLKPKGRALWAIRLAVYRKAGWKCVDCGWKPFRPEDYDGSYALYEIRDRTPTPRSPDTNMTVYLELGHRVEAWRGGKYVVRNLKAQCGPCNRKGSRPRPRRPQMEATA